MRRASASPGRQMQMGGEDWVMPSLASSAATGPIDFAQTQLLSQLGRIDHSPLM
jgi:hypothetical protein